MGVVCDLSKEFWLAIDAMINNRDLVHKCVKAFFLSQIGDRKFYECTDIFEFKKYIRCKVLPSI